MWMSCAQTPLSKSAGVSTICPCRVLGCDIGLLCFRLMSDVAFECLVKYPYQKVTTKNKRNHSSRGEMTLKQNEVSSKAFY